MKTMRLLTLSTLTVAMAACSSIPKKVDTTTPIVAKPNVVLDSSYPVYDTQTISVAEAPSVAALRWQEFYADAKLKELIELALANNKDLQKAALVVQNARAQYQITDITDKPKIGLAGGASRSAGRGDANPANSFSVNLALSSYELDLWGKIDSQKEQALQSYLATNAAKDAVQISLISGVAQAYVNLSYALAQRQLALETLKTREHSLMITQRRFSAGIDSKSPSLQAESSLEAAKLAIYAADTQLLQARNAMQLLLGTSVPERLLPDMAVNNIATQTLFSAGLPSELLRYRPDILQAEHALKAAGANINVARAAYFPSISLASSVGFGSNSLSNLIGASGFGWSIGPSVSLPIFDAGARKANHEMAQIAEKSALVSYEKAIQSAFKEVADVLATRATLEHQLESQYKLQKNYQQTYNIAHARFRAGLDNYLTVLDAERSLFANQQSILQLELQKILSQVHLYHVLGGGATVGAELIADESTQAAASTPATLATTEQIIKADEVVAPDEKLKMPKTLIKPLVEKLTK